MSLLMDALNKAEQAKRQGQATEADPGAATQPAQQPAAQPTQSAQPAKTAQPSLTLELTPLLIAAEPPASPEAVQAPPALPELPAHLGVLDEEFIAHAATTKTGAKAEKPPPRPAPAEPSPAPAATVNATKAVAIPQKAAVQDREAAQNLFTAKQPAPPRANKRFLLSIGLLTLVVASAIGVYFWLQLQPSGGLSMAKPGTNVSSPPIPPAQPVPPAPVAVVPAVLEAPPAPEPARPVVAPIRAEPPSLFHVTTSKLTLNPSLTNGYEAYIAGNYSAARDEYLQVLKSEPSNLDALHGMAAISLRQGQSAAAEEYYLKAIEADPKDALAHSGLIGLKSQIDPRQAETRLNALLAAQPELPFLHFTLGSLYARQNRWNEAQAAFFKAYSGEPDNPDTLFNLAVSLDQLHQPKLALRYYNLALAATANRPASFDKAQVVARLRELQP